MLGSGWGKRLFPCASTAWVSVQSVLPLLHGYIQRWHLQHPIPWPDSGPWSLGWAAHLMLCSARTFSFLIPRFSDSLLLKSAPWIPIQRWLEDRLPDFTACLPNPVIITNLFLHSLLILLGSNAWGLPVPPVEFIRVNILRVSGQKLVFPSRFWRRLWKSVTYQRLLLCSPCVLPAGLWGRGDHAGSLCQRPPHLQRQAEDQQIRLAQNPQDLLQEK